MKTAAIISTEELESLRLLGQRVRLSRLRRNLTQQELAERMGVGRLTVVSLEKGRPGVSLLTLLKALTVFGYTERLGDILAMDPIGEGMEIVTGRQRAAHVSGVADF
ncbi:transcriptional regulator (plasmid) [Methylobacterium phyllosphaerae]|uniref:Transcriptional regulator n=1 Tax=Methylobacterium phyllosphaerae TaxID=418223 RepID=A0AAE8HXT9_9HYPH|nr:helix-turn-helix transcriptional regulator [Methylobacterium phyllosphaerae]APT35024.1 transcriptional regulator [Methylobacterium phyllosphaerae]SFH67210.1 DNA-binding transcriptional regulator, XRE-family HTH domain [Methylobacterium phyllosphaerae]